MAPAVLACWNCQVNWIRSPVWVPPRSEKAQIIAAYELAPTKLIATDDKFSELSINLSIPPRHPRPALAGHRHEGDRYPESTGERIQAVRHQADDQRRCGGNQPERRALGGGRVVLTS